MLLLNFAHSLSCGSPLLDIVESFPLLSYCIVSPIYISPICNVEIRLIILWK